MESIAIIGAGMRLPGGVQALDGLAALLFGKVDAVREIPPERWSLAEHYDADHAAPGKSRARHAGLLDRLDLFDAEFFGIAPREAERLDPMHRLMLETGWEAIENAGIDPLSLAGSATGVYMAMGPSDYHRAVMADRPALDAYTATGSAYGTAVGRLSYFLDLIGPAIALDTGCSGALIAVHLAVQALRLGECDLALAGGVNAIVSPDFGVVFSKARMLAPDGRCRTFSADAQGFVRGEGAGVVVLRRLDDAIASGDRILGVIRGSATNQDGRSAGLTAPRQSSQEAVIAAALKAAAVDPLAVSFVEAHGTGTALGDPIEVAAIGNALCQGRPADKPLAIGSIKTNIGHLESAAGIAGLLKLLAAFARDAIPPNLHFGQPNPLIDWDALPITVPTEPIAWPRGETPRIAGVSSFGFGGSNVHMIVEEPPPGPVIAARDGSSAPMMLAISAATRGSLLELARRYRAMLEDDAPAHPSLADVCRATALGRAHFAHRLAFVADTRAQMRDAIDAVLAEATRGGMPTTPAPDGSGPTEEAARQYLSGGAIDRTAGYGGAPWRRVDLPAYPFDRKRHWAPQLAAFARPAAETVTVPTRPPLSTSLANAPAIRRLDMTLIHLREIMSEFRGDDAPLPLDAPWRDAGIDPLSADLHGRLETAFGDRLPPTLLLNNRTLHELARALVARIGSRSVQDTATIVPAARASMGDAALRDKLVARLNELR